MLGDLAQATGPWVADHWRTVAAQAGVEKTATLGELKLGYRVPSEVMEFAGRLLPEAAPSIVQPRSFRSTSEPVVVRVEPASLVGEAARLALENRIGTVAVIAPGLVHHDIARMIGARVTGEGTASISVLRPDDAKGLEFDTVIVVEPRLIAGDDTAGLRRLYVSFTRPTQQLTVLHSLDLPPPLVPRTALAPTAPEQIHRPVVVTDPGAPAAKPAHPGLNELLAIPVDRGRPHPSPVPDLSPSEGSGGVRSALRRLLKRA